MLIWHLSLNSDWILEICSSHLKTFTQTDPSQKGMDKNPVDNLSSSRPRADVYRTRSLIKPPPPRSSWELLLDEYLKDPNARSVGSPNLTAPPQPPAFHLFSQPASPDTFQQPFIPSPYPPPLPSPRYGTYPTSSELPPRRCQMTLDELVYLVSQVGRADLYREMVQYVKAQPTTSTSSPLPPSPSPSQHMNQSVNYNAHPMRSSSSNQESYFSSHVQDELIQKLRRLTMNAMLR